jgi:fumarate hydratase subunit alpha
MREVNVNEISKVIEELCIKANNNLPQDVKDTLRDALDKEVSPLGKEILKDILKNADIAEKHQVPICQDTGFAVVFLEIGQEVRLTGGDLNEAVNEGVRQGYKKGYLRKSIVTDPFITRKNTGDNTPAIIHTQIVPGDNIKITVAPKGGGSENMSALRMLKPADGVKGIKDFVLETVDKAGPNPCPPIVVGVGVGGTIEIATLIAKKALLRPLGQHHPQAEVAELERELLEEINKLGLGPQGLGGRTTALAVNIETFPAHIASLPVAINIQCHAARHAEATI